MWYTTKERMVEKMKLVITLIGIWLLLGLLAAILAVVYDVMIDKVRIRRREIRGMAMMVLLGASSLVLAVYYIIDEIRDRRKWKKMRKKA